MTLIYLDTETTGLDPDMHQVWEIAYAIDDEEPISAVVSHSLKSAQRQALEINGYHDRGGSRGLLSNEDSWEAKLRSAFDYEVALHIAPMTTLTGSLVRGSTSAIAGSVYTTVRRDTPATLVGANPAFDAAFLKKRWNGRAPWHYRMLDIESYAMPLLGFVRPVGLLGIIQDLNDEHECMIPEPDHSALGDVVATRAAHRALQRIARSRLP